MRQRAREPPRGRPRAHRPRFPSTRPGCVSRWSRRSGSRTHLLRAAVARGGSSSPRIRGRRAPPTRGRAGPNRWEAGRRIRNTGRRPGTTTQRPCWFGGVPRTGQASPRTCRAARGRDAPVSPAPPPFRTTNSSIPSPSKSNASGGVSAPGGHASDALRRDRHPSPPRAGTSRACRSPCSRTLRHRDAEVAVSVRAADLKAVSMPKGQPPGRQRTSVCPPAARPSAHAHARRRDRAYRPRRGPRIELRSQGPPAAHGLPHVLEPRRLTDGRGGPGRHGKRNRSSPDPFPSYSAAGVHRPPISLVTPSTDLSETSWPADERPVRRRAPVRSIGVVAHELSPGRRSWLRSRKTGMRPRTPDVLPPRTRLPDP